MIRQLHILFRIIVSLSLFFFILSQANAQTISVTATTPPHPTDFQFSLTSSTNNPIPQNTIVPYTITYGSQQSAGYAIGETITADFSQDTIAGGHLFDYVLGSASNGYGNTIPIVDLLQRTITWNISSLPAGSTNKSLSFELESNGNFTGTTPVTFSVKASMSNQFFQLANQSLSQTYQYTPLTTVAPTPTIQQTSPQITNIDLRTITSRSLVLSVETNVLTTLQVFLGTTLDTMKQTLIVSLLQKTHDITLTNLLPETTYYVKIIATDQNGILITSDIYSFKTARASIAPVVQPSSLFITSSDITLFTPQEENKFAVLVLPENTPYSFRFQIPNNNTIKSVVAIVRNKSVLGINSDETQDPNSLTTIVIPLNGGSYEGRLKAPIKPGTYQIFIRIIDTSGNITENPIADLYTNEGFSVLDLQTKTPVEKAQIKTYYKAFNARVYELLPPELFPIKNPLYTDITGKIPLTLPQGKYKAVITAIGYEQKEVFFTLGPLPGEVYPTIEMKKSPYNISTVFTYYVTILSDSILITRLYIQNISDSLRFFELNALLSTAFFVFLTLLSFSTRIHIPLSSLIEYFLHINKIKKVRTQIGNSIKGRIFDKEAGSILPNTDIFLIDEDKKSIVGHTLTDLNG